jgi:hypothetical protein
VRKKKLLLQSRQAAKGFSNFFASFLLSEKKKKLARKACLPQAGREDAKGFFLCASAR